MIYPIKLLIFVETKNIEIMEENKKQAFPTLFYCKTTGEPNGHDAGMTLRDYFANDAEIDRGFINGFTVSEIKDLMSIEDLPNGKEYLILMFELEAKLKYMKADAMLKQREL